MKTHIKCNILIKSLIIIIFIVLCCAVNFYANCHAYADDNISTEEVEENLQQMSVNSECRTDKEHTIAGISDNPQFNAKYPHTSIKQFTDVRYISNSNYFLYNPKHYENGENAGLNIAGVCTTVSLQMLMGYHNYYSDRRIIPAANNNRIFLDAGYGDVTENPMLKSNITVGQGCPKIGTTDDFFKELYESMRWPDFPLLAQAIGLVKETGINFMNNYTPQAVRDNISLTSGGFSKSIAQADIEADRPIVLVMQPFNEGESFHVVPVYGYAKLDGVDGFLVHYGWGACRTQVWVPSSWFICQMRMTVDHKHSMVDTGKNVNFSHREFLCSECGYRTIEKLYDTNSSGNQITKANYPLSGSIVIPEKFMITLSRV